MWGMPRRKDDRSTTIYWIFDTRLSPVGVPFYCGKTVFSLSRRFKTHIRDAVRGADRPLHSRLRECGDFVCIQAMEIVPATQDWTLREKHWIAILRHAFGSVNVADGGAGPTGFVHRESTKQKLRRSLSPETRAKISAANKGRKQSPEWIAKRTSKRIGMRASDETRAKIGAAHRGKEISKEQRAKLSIAGRGRKQSTAEIERRTVSLKGMRRSAEVRARMSASAKLRCASGSERNSKGQFV
jgi:hypothetical protein